MEQSKQKKRPGPRPVFGAVMKRCNVMLDEVTIEAARALGKGNLSNGLRRAIAAAIGRELDA